MRLYKQGSGGGGDDWENGRMIHGPGRGGLSPVNFRGGSICEAENLKIDPLKPSTPASSMERLHSCIPRGMYIPVSRHLGQWITGQRLRGNVLQTELGSHLWLYTWAKTPSLHLSFPHGSNELHSLVGLKAIVHVKHIS